MSEWPFIFLASCEALLVEVAAMVAYRLSSSAFSERSLEPKPVFFLSEKIPETPSCHLDVC